MSDTWGLINYAQSTMAWKTSTGSLGTFRISSVLYDRRLCQPMYLSCPVLAGDVYGAGLIPRRPLYHFLWATDGRDAKIFRLYSNEKVIADGIANTSIASIAVETEKTLGKKIEVQDLILLEEKSASNLICRIHSQDFMMEFPVWHINTHACEQLFQVETGPVLTKIDGGLVPSFIFFNSLDKIQIVPYFPLLIDQIHIQRMDVEFYLAS